MEMAILSARVFTGDPSKPWGEALLLKDERIVEIGSNMDVRDTCSRGAEVLDLPGRLVTPGLVDAHCHFLSFGMSLRTVDLRNLGSLAACRRRIKQESSSRQPGEWILGRGWNHHQWEEGREPTRHDLDDILSDNPAMMVRACGHSVWVNSVALAKAGITRDTPDPAGGKIDRETHGREPTGLLRGARHLIEEAIPPPDLEGWKEMALAAQQEALRFGITGVHSCESLRQWEALDALDKEGRLKIRIYHLLPADDLEEAARLRIEPGGGSERLWFGHVKLFADGSLGAGTALLHEPYCDDASQMGIAYLTPQELFEKIQMAYSQDWDVAIHAIGDRGVSNALEAIASARRTHPGNRRDRIEHVQLFRPDDLDLFKRLGAVASVQPAFVPTDWLAAEKKWGLSRCLNAYAWKSLLTEAIPLQFGSDAPVEPIDPILGMQAAVTRQTTEGEPPGGWFPDERLTLEESLEGFTRVSAWTSRVEDKLGTLMPGKRADLTVFEQDLFHLPPPHWPSVQAEMTVVNGEVVYQKDARG